MVHLTRILCTARIRAAYHWRLKWRTKIEKAKLRGPIVPPSFLERGVKIINAATEQKQHEEQIEGYFPWKADHPMFKPDVGDGPENPMYKKIPCRIFREGTDLPEGLEQAQLLTKTVVTKGIPPIWEFAEQQIQALRFADEDERARRCVMQSVRWDTAKLKLPKRTLYHGHVYPYYYGITLQKANDMICQNLLRLTELTFSGMPQILSRHLVKNALMNVTYEPVGPNDDRVVFNCNNGLMFTNNQPMQPFFNPEQVNATKEIELPSIYPLKPTLNLDEVNVYDWETSYPFTSKCNFALPHTIVVQHNQTDKNWSLSQKQATAIVHCHATLAALARQMFGGDVSVLPHPLSVQCIHADRGRHFTFYAYQLNTLDMASKDGIKNQVWVDAESKTAIVNDESVVTEKPYTLFSLADQMEGLMGYQMYREKDSHLRYPMRSLNTYNPTVMTKLLTLYATQLHLGHQHTANVAVEKEEPVQSQKSAVAM